MAVLTHLGCDCSFEVKNSREGSQIESNHSPFGIETVSLCRVDSEPALVSWLSQGLAFTSMFIAGTRDLLAGGEGTGSARINHARAAHLGERSGWRFSLWIYGSAPTRESLDVRSTVIA